MKTIFNKDTREELIKRIESLSEDSSGQWGKMNVSQMLRHCILFDEWVLGKNNPIYKQVFIGRLFGKMALKDFIKDESPLRRNIGTLDNLKVTANNGDLALEKSKWIALINEYENFSNPDFIHTFFGKTTKEQIGRLSYKHTNHHLSQFGV